MPMLEGRHICRHREPVSGFASKSAEAHYPPDIELEPKHLAIDLTVDIGEKSLEGSVTITFEARRDGPTSVELDAVDFLDLTVTDPDGSKLDWSYHNDKIRLDWDEEFSEGEQRRAEVSYRLEEPVAGVYFSAPDDAYPDAPRWAATDHETERARHWLPCIDLPQVRTTLEFSLRSDADYTILANGALQGEEEHDDGTKTARWKLDFPCPSYLVCFVLGELVEYDDGALGEMPIKYYGVAPNTSDDLQRSFDRTAKIMEWMTGRLDRDFPFPKYFQFAVPGIGGAMENISLVSWEASYLLVEELEAEWKWLIDQVNVHEMAHSWFGDSVVCREFAHAWLKESWATYMETCWLEDSKGEDEQRYDLWRNASAYFEEADESYSRPIVLREYDASFDLYDRHLYPGGACRLHMLRKMLGDDTFWSGVHLYLDRFEGRTVETDDFRKVMEEVSGRSLVQFFEQWFLKAGYPKLKVSWSWDDDESLGRWTFEQDQVDEKSGEGPLFRGLEIELGWVIEGKMSTRKVVIDERKASFSVKMPEKPKEVRVDPHGKSLFKLEFNPSDELLRRQLTESNDVIGSILAAHELARTGKAKNLQAIIDAWDDEPFWGVRREFADALTASKTEQALVAMLDFARHESDPMVLSHIFGQLAKFKDERSIDVYKSRIEEGVGPLAQRAALLAIGEIGGEDSIGYLDAIARQADNTWVREGALNGLAKTRSADAFEPLERHLVYGGDQHIVRSSAARALGSLIPTLPEHERHPMLERLKALLRDPNGGVKLGAARGLGTAGANEAAEEIEAMARTLTAQERTNVEKIARGLRKSQSPKLKALQDEVDSLRALIRKLEDRVRLIEE